VRCQDQLLCQAGSPLVGLSLIISEMPLLNNHLLVPIREQGGLAPHPEGVRTEQVQGPLQPHDALSYPSSTSKAFAGKREQIHRPYVEQHSLHVSSHQASMVPGCMGKTNL